MIPRGGSFAPIQVTKEVPMSDDETVVKQQKEGNSSDPPAKTSISLELLRESVSQAKKRPNFKSASLARRSQSARTNSRPLRRRGRRRSSSGSLASGSSSDSTALMTLLPSRPCLRHSSANGAVSRSLDDLLVPFNHSKSVKFYLPETPSNADTATDGSNSMPQLHPSYRVPFLPDYRSPTTAAAAAAFATAFYYPTTVPYYYYLASTAVYTNTAAAPVSSTGWKVLPGLGPAPPETSSMTEVRMP